MLCIIVRVPVRSNERLWRINVDRVVGWYPLCMKDMCPRVQCGYLLLSCWPSYYWRYLRRGCLFWLRTERLVIDLRDSVSLGIASYWTNMAALYGLYSTTGSLCKGETEPLVACIGDDSVSP